MWLRVTIAACVVFVAVWYARHDTDDDIPPLADKLNDSYDYIIVGGGSAGCVLASRLSEDSDVTVLLIEAGGDDRGREDLAVPAVVPSLHHSDVDWDYISEPQDGMVGNKDRRIYLAAGRVLGGTSSINYMIYVRGHRRDYDQWAAQGCEGWSYKDVLPYFMKSERMEDVEHIDKKYHGAEGPLRVEVMKAGIGLTDVLVKAAKELGLNVVDNNAEVGEGISYAQMTFYKGRRSSTSRAFLHPVLHRPNLHVVVNTFVKKVLFEGKRAVGVEFVRRSRTQSVRAKREVILSSGAIGSPKILLLSGVGPKKHLAEMKIPLVADLPVGENFLDHVTMFYHVTLKQPLSVTPQDRESWWSALKLKLFGTGLLSHTAEEVHMFLSTSESSKQQQWPDVQILTSSFVWPTSAMEAMGASEQALKDMSPRNNITHGFVLIPVVSRPKSRGTLRLSSTDPFRYPLINPKYLSHPDDLDTLERGVQACQKLIQTKSLQAAGAEFTDNINSACSARGKYNTSHSEYWRCLLKRNALSFPHYSGTCKMGAATDPSAVVDPKLRVRGLEGLRVVDASVFPNLPTGNTNAPVIMAAEKAADIIRQARHKKEK